MLNIDFANIDGTKISRILANPATSPYKTHGGTWAPGRSCTSHDLFLSGNGTQCGNCGAYTSDHGKTWIPVK